MEDIKSLKEEGLAEYKDGNYQAAARYWREAVEMLSDIADAVGVFRSVDSHSNA